MVPLSRKGQAHLDSTLKKKRSHSRDGPVLAQTLTTASSASLASCGQWGP